MTVEKMMGNLRALDIPMEVEKALNNLKPEMEQAQRNQMLKGQDVNGAKITYKGRDGSAKDTYSAAYARKMGRPITPIILKKTGSFQSRIKADVKKSVVDFSSTDSKNDMLLAKSGEVIFGLNASTLDDVRPVAQTEMINNVAFKLGLT